MHVTDTPHNSVILSREGLQNLGKAELFQLLLQNDLHLLPEVREADYPLSINCMSKN